MKHKLIHSAEWPYSCGVRNKAFSRKNHLMTISSYIVGSGHTPVVCVRKYLVGTVT